MGKAMAKATNGAHHAIGRRNLSEEEKVVVRNRLKMPMVVSRPQSARIETITPAEARKLSERCAEILKQDPDRQGNRRYDAEYALLLASAIENGEWELNGETIKIAVDGFVEDGQHRLGAVIFADKPIETFVARNLPVGCFDTVDCGKKRSGADVLSRHGERYCSELAGALNWLWRYETGAIKKVGRTSRLRSRQLTAFLDKHPSLRASAPIGPTLRGIIPSTVGVCCHYLFSLRDAKLADEFFEKLASGVELKRTSPIYMLREQLRDRRPKFKLNSADAFALTIKAWNALRNDKPVKLLRWNGYGDKPEPFPRVE